MTFRVLIIYPLFYSPYSLLRLSAYISHSDIKIQKDVAVFCSNQNIEQLSRNLSEKLNYQFYVRDNFGGGEGVFLELDRIIDLEQYQYIIYLEESCEPISRYWIELLLKDLNNGTLITGWRWNWRGKKRKNSRRFMLGGGTRLALGYWNDPKSLPSKVFQTKKIMDAPAFHHECIAFHKSALEFTNLGAVKKELWSNYNPKDFGLAMERFYWDSVEPQSFVSPNIQYLLLKNQKVLPNYGSKNFKFFVELKEKDKNTPNISIYQWRFRRRRLLNLPKLISFKISNFVKFVIVIKCGVDINSKMKDVL
jgi:hypothetical protein